MFLGLNLSRSPFQVKLKFIFLSLIHYTQQTVSTALARHICSVSYLEWKFRTNCLTDIYTVQPVS